MNDVFLHSPLWKLHPLIQKWGVVHWLKLIWDFKSEINSLHFNDFTLVKVISWVKTHYDDPLWGVTLYYFPGMCVFKCIPLQTSEIYVII